MSDDIIDEIEEAIQRLEEHSEKTSDIRETVIAKLKITVDALEIDPANDKSTMIEAKMGVVNTLLKALDDHDKQKFNILKVKQQKVEKASKDTEAKQIGSMVAEYLKKIDSTISLLSNDIESELKNTNDSRLEQLLEEAINDAGLDPILDGELLFSAPKKEEPKEE